MVLTVWASWKSENGDWDCTYQAKAIVGTCGPNKASDPHSGMSHDSLNMYLWTHISHLCLHLYPVLFVDPTSRGCHGVQIGLIFHAPLEHQIPVKGMPRPSRPCTAVLAVEGFSTRVVAMRNCIAGTDATADCVAVQCSTRFSHTDIHCSDRATR